MAYLTEKQRVIGLNLRGKLGIPNGLGESICGWSFFGDWDEFAGYYQNHTTAKGKELVRARPYWPKNIETETRRAWRDVFAAGVLAWHNLTAETKLAYNKLKFPARMSGFCRFMREYLKANKL